MNTTPSPAQGSSGVTEEEIARPCFTSVRVEFVEQAFADRAQITTLQARLAEVEKERSAAEARVRGLEAVSRSNRQAVVFDWGCRAFGNDQMRSTQQRGLRLMEEAIELAQSVFCDPDQLHRLIDYVYGRPVGVAEAELGGVGVCLLAMAECLRADADECERREAARVLSKPIEHFAKRNAEKNDAGFRPTLTDEQQQ